MITFTFLVLGVIALAFLTFGLIYRVRHYREVETDGRRVVDKELRPNETCTDIKRVVMVADGREFLVDPKVYHSITIGDTYDSNATVTGEIL